MASAGFSAKDSGLGESAQAGEKTPPTIGDAGKPYYFLADEWGVCSVWAIHGGNHPASIGEIYGGMMAIESDGGWASAF